MLLTTILLGMASYLSAQDTTGSASGISLLVHPSSIMQFGDRLSGQPLFGNSRAMVSIKHMPATYSYTQGKLPLFCALEDRIWRRTGLGMQFRLIDRPLGFK